MYAKINRLGIRKGCTYWCEFFGLTTYTTAIFGLGITIF